MGACCKITLIVFLLSTIFIGYQLYIKINYVPPIPKLSRTQYWGLGEESKIDTGITTFSIKFEKEVIEDLKSRLKKTRFTEPLEGVAFKYGFRHSELKKIVDYWANKYDFLEREKYINKYAHYKTNIQGLNMHYLHIKPKAQPGIKVLPMLMLHGWPGSVLEFYKIIPMLTTPAQGRDFVFELVIPSLPGFGWSQGTTKPNLGVGEIAVIMANLMERLGHTKYYVQGGDWGSFIGHSMSVLNPENVLGYHSNMPSSRLFISQLRHFVGALVPSLIVDEKFAHRLYPIRKIFNDIMYESGYFHIQATKPDSLGAALGDSPAGLAAWILEKFSMGTNMEYRERDDGGLLEKFTMNELLDNLMVYWVNNAATTSARIYSESFNLRYMNEIQLESIPARVPMAAARFPHEIFYNTDAQLRDKYPNMVQVTDMPRGGHFAAMEEPQLLANNIVSAVKKFQEFHKKQKKAKDDL